MVDDGIATGATMRAALRAVRRQGPAKLILAVPVAPSDALAELRGEADEIVCLDNREGLGSVGWFYSDFTQVSDERSARYPGGVSGRTVGSGGTAPVRVHSHDHSGAYGTGER